MKRIQVILGGCLILLGIVTGCSHTSYNKQEKEVVQSVEEAIEEKAFYNTAFEQYAQDNVVALVLNDPEQELVNRLTHLETYKHSENTEQLLIIPKYNGSKIEIKKVSFDGKKIVEQETLYTKRSTQNDYGLLIQTFRPEGIPELLVRVTTGDETVAYLIAENGKDGAGVPIYLSTNEVYQSDKPLKNEQLDEIEEIIYPMEEESSLQDYTLLSINEADIDYDKQMETIEVYCSASLGEDGNLIMDDGNKWKVIVRKGNKLYPVLDSFIQLGHLEYKTYGEYREEKEEHVFHLFISKIQGAGFTMYDCYYDDTQEVFISKKAYQTVGNTEMYGITY